MVINDPQQATFDRILGGLAHDPGVKRARPTTVITTLPIVGTTTTYVVQTHRTEEGEYIVFLQVVDAEGRERFVIPNRVAQALYRQRQALTDRSTPASRAARQRKIQREKARRDKETRRQAWAEKNNHH